MTNRPSNHDPKAKAESGSIEGFSWYNVCDSFSSSAFRSSSGESDHSRQRLSKKQLINLEATLGEKAKLVLLNLQQYRYLMSSQIQRLIFTDALLHPLHCEPPTVA